MSLDGRTVPSRGRRRGLLRTGGTVSHLVAATQALEVGLNLHRPQDTLTRLFLGSARLLLSPSPTRLLLGMESGGNVLPALLLRRQGLPSCLGQQADLRDVEHRMAADRDPCAEGALD